jgi:hypothetical protein
MFMHNPMSMEYRKQLLRYGYESARRALLADLPRWQEAFGKQGIAVAPDRLRPSREAVR